MALEMNDLMALKSLENGMTPYEQFKTQHIQAKEHTSGVAIAGLATGITGVVIGGTAWLFSGMFANAKAKEAKEAAKSAKELAMAYYSGIDKRLDNIGALLESEVSRRIAGDQTITQTITDTVSGSQSGQLTASQIAQQEATRSVMTGLMTGRYSENPLKVVRVSGQRECPCDSGCGYNG